MKLYVMTANTTYFIEHDSDDDVRVVLERLRYRLEGVAEKYIWDGPTLKLADIIMIWHLLTAGRASVSSLFNALSTSVIRDVCRREQSALGKTEARDHDLRTITNALAKREQKEKGK